MAVSASPPALDALYVMAVWLMVGMSFGFFATVYGALRRVYHFWPGVGEFFDWLWFVLAGALFVTVLFWTEWGIFRIWTVAFVLLGYLLWTWLASPLTLGALSFFFRLQARAFHYGYVPVLTVARFVKRSGAHWRNPPPKE